MIVLEIFKWIVFVRCWFLVSLVIKLVFKCINFLVYLNRVMFLWVGLSCLKLWLRILKFKLFLREVIFCEMVGWVVCNFVVVLLKLFKVII